MSDGTDFRQARVRRLVTLVDLLITPERLRIYPVILIVAGGLGLAAATVAHILDAGGHGTLLPDYLAHWTGGLLLWENPRELYDPQTQNQIQGAAIGATADLAWFVSPPIVAALYAPLALMPYNVSGIFWSVLSSALLVWCIRSLDTIAPTLVPHKRKLVIVAVLAAPPTFEIMGSGQDSAFVLVLWLVGIRLFQTCHPLWAGAVLGLGFAKPQLVLVVPLVLLATRNYKALAAFSAVVAAISAVSLGLVGIDGIRQWTAAISSPLYMDEVQQGQAWKMVGLPSFVQALLPPEWGAGVAPLLTTASLPIGATVLVSTLLRLRKAVIDPRAVWIATLATTVTFSPHLATYDAVLFVPVVVFLLERRSSPSLRVATFLAFTLMWLVAPLHMLARPLPWPAGIVDAPWSALPLVAIWLESIRELRSGNLRAPQEAEQSDSPKDYR
ncbi:glycosyltransferase family 87 protein [Pseudarthrobacter sp. YS3]|uniref:glycosyltransferase family 87 protein n=1 Tax=Pseudarthrobacter sp. YS3 TaxID=3453718 RepID=UPI003EF07D18